MTNNEDVQRLAEFLHENYEKIARQENWKTQIKCQVKFDELPEANKKVMLKLAEKLINEGYRLEPGSMSYREIALINTGVLLLISIFYLLAGVDAGRPYALVGLLGYSFLFWRILTNRP